MKIIGTGSALPAQCITNDQLRQILDTSDEWIKTRTGISTRHILRDETLTDLGAEAALAALSMAGIGVNDIDYILCSTVQGDLRTPSLASLISERIGLSCPAVDLNGACAGFIYALDIADALVATGKARRVMITCCEAMSRICDWNDRSTAVLFGDGAAAAIVAPGDNLIALKLTSQPDARLLNADVEWGNCPYSPAREHAPHMLYMAGQEVFKFAVNAAVNGVRSLLQAQNIEKEKLDFLLMHQANMRIMHTAAQRLGLCESQLPHIIEETGNTSSASLPILLDRVVREGLLLPDALIALSAFGAGLTAGTCLYRW